MYEQHRHNPHETSNAILGWKSTGSRLRAFLTSRGSSLYALERRGFAKSTVRRIAGGDRIGSLRTWMQVAESYGVCLSEIVEPETFERRAREVTR